jgi:intraflagellar transport protein 81
VLKGEDFKQYVNLLREKSLTYKQKRADLSDLKAEYGVLERTLEVLKYVYSFSF